MESKGKLIILSVAGVVVAFGAISIYNSVVGSREVEIVEKEPAKSRALVARKNLSPGTFVQVPQDADWAELPPALMTEDTVREGSVQLGAFNGAVVRRKMRAGDPIPKDGLMTSREGGFMSAVLESGYRAVSVAVNPTSGNAGFISPGDRVDMIVTRKVKNSGDSGDAQIISETFIEDVRVLAVDQQLNNPENKAILAKTVTVQVTPAQAERVAVAGELGKISLALRSAISDQKPEQEPSSGEDAESAMDIIDSTLQQDSAISDKPMDSGSMAPRIRVIRGDAIENVEMR